MSRARDVQSGSASCRDRVRSVWVWRVARVGCWLAVFAAVGLRHAVAADLYYDVIPSTADIDGGAANWSASNWKTTASGTAGGAWATNDTAIFNPIVGTPSTTTVTLSGTQTATAVTFNGAGYTLTGGTLSLAGTGSTTWINVNADATIASALTHLRFNRTGGSGSPVVTISGGSGGSTGVRPVIGDSSNLTTVRQTGGTITIASTEFFMVGGNGNASPTNAQGRYEITGGTLTVGQGIYLGWQASTRSGTFIQNGGTVETQNNGQGLQIGIEGGQGAYELNGGTLISTFASNNNHGGSFTFGGGTLQTRGTFTMNQPGVTTSIAPGATARINTNGATVTWTNVISGSTAAGLVKSGTGTLVLSGANSFAGNTTVNGGSLIIGNANALGNTTGTLTLARTNASDNSTKTSLDLRGFNLNNPIVVTANNPGVDDTGALQNTTVNTTSVLSGTVSFGSANYVGGAGNVRVEGVVSGGVNNNYTLYKLGTGTWTFANEANTFDGFYYVFGGTTAVTKLANVNQPSSLGQPTSATANQVSFGFNGNGGGTLRYIGSSASTSDRAFVLQGGTATVGRIDADGTSPAATLTLTGSLSAGRTGAYTAALGGTNAGVNTYSGVISNGSGTSVAVLKDGTTTWSLSGTNTYTGGTTLAAGTLSLGSAGALGSTGTITLSGGTLQFTSSNTTDYSARFSTAANQAYRFDTNGQNVTLASALGSSGGTLLKAGAGTLTLSGANTLGGASVLSAGTLSLGSAGALGTTGSILFSGGTLQFTASNTTDYSSRFSNLPGQSFLLDTNGQNVTLASNLTSSGSTLTKLGAGRLTLSGTNSYSGGTTVSAGTLLVNGNNAGAAGAVSVAAGATLGGSGTVGGATTISGTHSPGTSPGLQTFTNGLSYASTATLVWELSANTALSGARGTLYDGLNLTTAGALSIDPAASMSLVFDQPLADSTPSTVDWSDPFWGSDQQWVIADLSSPVTWNGTVFGTLNVGADSLGALLATVRPNASFSLADSGGDLVLNYVAVPEPGTWALVAAAAAGMIPLQCRRRVREMC